MPSTAVTATYALAVLCFVVGLGIVARLYRSLEGSTHQRVLAALALIPGVAGLAYAGMALGLGTVTVNGVEFVGLRYVDWLVTTPLLIGFVGYAADASRSRIGVAMAADAVMILAGAGATVAAAPALKWGLFAVSSVAHLSLFVSLYYLFPKTVPDDPTQFGLFSLLKNHIGLLWLAYPFVWVMGAPGLGYTGPVAMSLIYAFLDVLAKVPFVYFFYVRRAAFGGLIEDRAAASGPATAPADD
jgi:sensory rhodopsin